MRYLCHVQNTESQSTPPNSPALTLFPPLLLVCFLSIGSRGYAWSSQYSSVKTNYIYIRKDNIYYIYIIYFFAWLQENAEANERD